MLEGKRQAGQTARTTQSITAHAVGGAANRQSQETMHENELTFKVSEAAKQRKHELQKQQSEIEKELLLWRHIRISLLTSQARGGRQSMRVALRDGPHLTSWEISSQAPNLPPAGQYRDTIELCEYVQLLLDCID